MIIIINLILRLKGKIYLSDLNTFCIPIKECMDKYIYVYMFCFGVAFVILGIFELIFGYNKKEVVIVGIGFILFGIIFICVLIRQDNINFHTVYFMMGENSLTLIQKSICRKKEIIYDSGEIEKVEFQKTKKNEEEYIYKLEIISKNKGNKIIFS